jgi:hypothetical protein
MQNVMSTESAAMVAARRETLSASKTPPNPKAARSRFGELLGDDEARSQDDRNRFTEVEIAQAELLEDNAGFTGVLSWRAREELMSQLIYAASAIAVGGRDGITGTTDGRFEVKLARPKELGGSDDGCNPEQLFASATRRASSTPFN